MIPIIGAPVVRQLTPEQMLKELCLSEEDSMWLLKRVKAWDKKVLAKAVELKIKPTMALAVTVGKRMLLERG